MLGESTIRRSGLVREDREGVPEKAVLELEIGEQELTRQNMKSMCKGPVTQCSWNIENEKGDVPERQEGLHHSGPCGPC